MYPSPWAGQNLGEHVGFQLWSGLENGSAPWMYPTSLWLGHPRVSVINSPLRRMTTTQLLGRSSSDSANVIQFSGLGPSERRPPYHPFTRMDTRNTQYNRPALAPHLSAGVPAIQRDIAPFAPLLSAGVPAIHRGIAPYAPLLSAGVPAIQRGIAPFAPLLSAGTAAFKWHNDFSNMICERSMSVATSPKQGADEIRRVNRLIESKLEGNGKLNKLIPLKTSFWLGISRGIRCLLRPRVTTTSSC